MKNIATIFTTFKIFFEYLHVPSSVMVTHKYGDMGHIHIVQHIQGHTSVHCISRNKSNPENLQCTLQI